MLSRLARIVHTAAAAATPRVLCITHRSVLAPHLSRRYRNGASPPSSSPPSSSAHTLPAIDDIPKRIAASIPSWMRLSSTKRTLETLGLTQRDIDYLLPRFKLIALAELKTRHTTSNEWAFQYLESHLSSKSDAPSIQDALQRAIMMRFLRWAASQPAPLDSLDPSMAEAQIIAGSLPYSHLSHIANLLDWRDPASWFPVARRARRKLIMHVGPTNSGKTYAALTALATAKNGTYAGPLRLLAHEIYYRLNNGLITIPHPETGKPTPVNTQCNLLTGEERKITSLDAPFASMTIEMSNFMAAVDVAIIDEIQMLADPERGPSWTKALLGLRAKELHLCGEETAVDLVRQLAEQTGDELIVNRYERLTPLSVDSRSVGDLSNIKAGDCVVGFSRSGLFRLKVEIEKKTGLKCAMVYGGLPPETRAEQAELFNNETSGYDVLVASDAVGMGLNLKIRRVVFSTLTKFDGAADVHLPVSQIKQIAGRAGRFGQQGSNSMGVVATLDPQDMRTLKSSMRQKLKPLDGAVLEATPEMVENLAALVPPGTSFRNLMLLFSEYAMVFPPYCAVSALTNFKRSKALDIIDRYGRELPIAECLNLLHLPINWRAPTGPIVSRNAAIMDSEAASVTLKDMFKETTIPQAIEKAKRLQTAWELAGEGAVKDQVVREMKVTRHRLLGELEAAHKAVTAYLWMSLRAPATYAEHSEAVAMQSDIEQRIEFYLTLAMEVEGKDPSARVLGPRRYKAPSVFAEPGQRTSNRERRVDHY